MWNFIIINNNSFICLFTGNCMISINDVRFCKFFLHIHYHASHIDESIIIILYHTGQSCFKGRTSRGIKLQNHKRHPTVSFPHGQAVRCLQGVFWEKNVLVWHHCNRNIVVHIQLVWHSLDEHYLLSGCNWLPGLAKGSPLLPSYYLEPRASQPPHNTLLVQYML